MALDPQAAWWDQPLAVLDFETTGPDPEVCEPVSVAVIRLEQGRECGAFFSFLRPTIPIPPEASAIHQIYDEMVASAPALVDVAGDLARLADHALPCGYNAIHFDRPLLHRYVQGTDCPLFDEAQGWADPLVIIRKVDRWVSGKGRHKLGRVCARYGCPIPAAEEHTALGDVRATGRLLGQLVDRGLLRTGTTVARLVEYTQQQADEQRRDFERWLARQRAKEAQQQLQLDTDE